MNQAATHATGATVPQTPVSQNWPARSLTYRDPRLLALIFVTLVSTVQGIDPSLHGVAMPNVTTEFGLDRAISSFIRSIGTIVLAASMLGVGITGDLIGRKKVLVMGAFGMAIATTINAFAPNALIFGAGRVLMGITTAMSFAMCLAFVPALYTREELPKAFSIWLAIQSAAVVVAMLAGGAIFDIAGWRGTYLVTAGLSAIFGVLAVMYVPENKAQSSRKFDTLGVLLAATGLISLVYSLGQAATRGWSSPVVLGGTALALVVLTTFAVYESRLKDPGFPVTLFKIPAFAAACIVGVLFNFANASLIGQAPALLKAAGMPATSGLVISLLSGLLGVGCFFGAVISGWAQSKFKFSPRTMFVSGILVLAAGLLSQYLITVDNRIVIIAVGMLLVGFGIMWTQNPQSAVIMGSAPKEMVGAVGSVKPAVGQLGMGLGFGVSMPIATIFMTGGVFDVNSYRLGMMAEGFVFLVFAVLVYALLSISNKN